MGQALRLVFELTNGESPFGINVWNETDDENDEEPWFDRRISRQSSEVGELPDRRYIRYISFRRRGLRYLPLVMWKEFKKEQLEMIAIQLP
ncbi:hypothetical protein FHR92_004143 [Fontibacillus solani]|uniref:Uncharacterized protein n=1 Tax=Fontibacillus solani TaxID=1572857 RepID=A0A7W3SWY5_9BACL|nr:hypothetical protein [Fontibacillus solani]MBA9087658.1 hypothetical protein [Fontibacillus solani]